jgi:hypothetical protein
VRQRCSAGKAQSRAVPQGNEAPRTHGESVSGRRGLPVLRAIR